MKIFIDSSIFLKLMLDEAEATKAQDILENVEYSKVLGYVTPLILEEVIFKLIFAEASSKLNTTNIWKIRSELKENKALKMECIKVARKCMEYIDHLSMRGLRIEGVFFNDWIKSIEYIEKYGLLPADALHLAVAKRLEVNAIATFDEDFKVIDEIKIIP
ncbi:MAG: PIN domain-containing protein [Candidatus Methanomethylicia archaeon]